VNSDGPHRLCCLILTQSDEAALSRTLESTAFADQRVIVVAAEHSAPFNANNHSIPVLRFDEAAAAIAAPWTLILFAGDSVTTALVEECRTACSGESEHNTFSLSIESYFLNRRMRRSDLSPHTETRLIRTQLVHDFLAVQNGNPRKLQSSVMLRAPLIHHDASTLQNLITQVNDVTSLEAGIAAQSDIRSDDRHPSFVLAPFREFIHVYIGMQGFRDGIHGFLYATYIAVRVLLAAAKRWEYARAVIGKTELPPVTSNDLIKLKQLG
jgi:hypothetical protein